MDDRHRSPVPDLLFEDVRDARLREIGHLLDRPEDVDAASPLHRITVFLTYRCNLACTYCKTIARSPEEIAARPQKAVTFSLDDFARFLDSHAGTPIRHVHFTGGEAAIVLGLPDMVRLCRTRGVERISITSNGTMPPDFYLSLLDAGMDEIRISLDAADPALGEALTLRSGMWRRAVRTIQGLAAERRRGREFFLIVNTVAGPENAAALPRILRFLLALGPDDIKLITSVEAKDHLAAAQSSQAGRAISLALHALMARRPAGSFPLLRRKLRTVFSADAIGLERVPASGPWKCFIPLTERTVDGVNYYPCSVYLREGGAPLGRITEPQHEQRRRTVAFVNESDCLKDPICRKYCLHCTRLYNEEANLEPAELRAA